MLDVQRMDGSREVIGLMTAPIVLEDLARRALAGDRDALDVRQ